MEWRVALSGPAEIDLENTVAFLARQSPSAAIQVGLELVNVVFSLDQFPNRGTPVRGRPGLRKLSHRYYLVFYRVNEPARLVEIVRIWDGRQNPSSLDLP